jgi:hypothetical protein
MFVALVALFLFSAPAFAGSGGTKKDATIVVRNDQSSQIVVAVGERAIADVQALFAGEATPSQAQIVAAGGKVLNPGVSVSFKVVAGTYPLFAAASPSDNAQIDVTLGKGQTKNYAFTPSSTLVAY